MGVNLISSTALVQTPYITVKIGRYTFGCYNSDAVGSEKYPNYVSSLSIDKINGQVNTYTLVLKYAVNEQNDPNYFEKVFSSVSQTRRIEFTYGDLSNVNYIYKNEKAIITQVSTDFSTDSCITYTVKAVSEGSLSLSGSYPFPAPNHPVKPSDIIKNIVRQNSIYGLQDLFTGMKNEMYLNELIPGNDVAKTIESKTNISVLDYIQYLVDCMDTEVNSSSITKKSFFIMNFIDDTTGKYGGPYFKIVEVNKEVEHPEAYELYVGYPNSNMVDNFRVENSENYSIYYDYQEKLHPEQYIRRINTLGEWEDVYAPVLSSKNNNYQTRESDRSWWSKTSQYPISVSLDVKGLLRPAILMSYVRLYIMFYGRLHINSGLYIITKQSDAINESGYKTTLNMTRVASDNTMTII